MKREYDFRSGRRGAVAPVTLGKTRITIRLDETILQWFREQVHTQGGGNYQSLINAVLLRHMESERQPLEETLRRVIREVMRYRVGTAAKLPASLTAASSASRGRARWPGGAALRLDGTGATLQELRRLRRKIG